jgi:hypothetical protein
MATLVRTDTSGNVVAAEDVTNAALDPFQDRIDAAARIGRRGVERESEWIRRRPCRRLQLEYPKLEIIHLVDFGVELVSCFHKLGFDGVEEGLAVSTAIPEYGEFTPKLPTKVVIRGTEVVLYAEDKMESIVIKVSAGGRAFQ